MDEDDATMREIAEAIGLEFNPKWKGLQFSKATGRTALSERNTP